MKISALEKALHPGLVGGSEEASVAMGVMGMMIIMVASMRGDDEGDGGGDGDEDDRGGRDDNGDVHMEVTAVTTVMMYWVGVVKAMM